MLPSYSILPCFSTIARSHTWRTMCVEWLTITIVAPCSWRARSRAKHFCWKRASPTARTSSTSRMVGSMCAMTAKPSRMNMPDE